MNIKIKGIDIEVTEAIKDYVTKKVGEALEKFNHLSESQNILAEVELSKTNNHHSHGELYKVSVKLPEFLINRGDKPIKFVIVVINSLYVITLVAEMSHSKETSRETELRVQGHSSQQHIHTKDSK